VYQCGEAFRLFQMDGVTCARHDLELSLWKLLRHPLANSAKLAIQFACNE
jgi:hypothetical protein